MTVQDIMDLFVTLGFDPASVVQLGALMTVLTGLYKRASAGYSRAIELAERIEENGIPVRVVAVEEGATIVRRESNVRLVE